MCKTKLKASKPFNWNKVSCVRSDLDGTDGYTKGVGIWMKESSLKRWFTTYM